ncbi:MULTISPECIES: fimbria/pilus periplasmic chaperone [Pseudomonas]|uniref:Fimbria/pilus periplasmic chaperone n=1 Tax=Pseudomonas gessardii TaxID=78544 RepID=A0ABS9FCR5_9PSED|nr:MULTISPECIES: fimbria/pilus periplasmic chaperone [Pseudomonas]MBH3421108.1 fimbria/pilus periplasmic chaperone [Pseudomonas gessardii]MCF4980926.1 fimbria/pilus periplasmic chaperone [Pseudomonas gessardii]MCF4991877.1 fimbria/pilus periplasmic chaperone [Pseudomonas gessardii]MCF5083930.1 fimbria/pilus periplasmic chaperone [Pseudomonas gessardii]MCF5095783.1 fimbria/pilus periplasmic chaperone [Pseudomonas gessardii]
MNIKSKFYVVLGASLLALGLVAGSSANASVVIAGTRVIYNAPEHETTLKISNKGQEPALIQAWVDNGEANAEPSEIDVPFTVTPPLARLDPQKSQTLRIFYTGEALPKNKESVFWLNVLEVPPRPAADKEDKNHLQLAIRSRIKLFFRPADLKGDAAHTPGSITWRLIRDAGGSALEAHNPSVFHASFASLEVGSGGKTATFEEGGMLAPGETRSFPLKGQVSSGIDAKVHYRAINDYGGITEGDASLISTASQAK